MYKTENTAVARRFCESSRPFLCMRNMYYYQQRCANIICNPKPFYRFHIFLRSVCFPERSVGSLPDAHFCVYGICIITNNADFIKYRTQTLLPFPHLYSLCVFPKTWIYISRINPSIIVCSPKRNGGLHPAAQFCVRGICIITNNAVPI